jgi:Ankyrin repeats (3 copies)
VARKQPPEVEAYVHAIAESSSEALTAAIEAARSALTSQTAGALTKAVAETLTTGHAIVEHAGAIAGFIIAAVEAIGDPTLAAIFGSSPLGRLDEALEEVVTSATQSLPAAKGVLEALNGRLLANPKLANQMAGSAYFYFHTVEMDGDPIPVKSSGGVSTTDLVYTRLNLALTLASATEMLWDFCMKLVAKLPTARGLPEKAKQVPKIDPLNDLDFGYLFALLRAGVTHEDPEISRVVIADALEQFRKQAPPHERLIAFARAALATDLKAAAGLAVQLATLGVDVSALPPPTPQDVLLALDGSRWDDARAMLEGGVRMERPGCRPNGAIHLVSVAPDPIRFPLIELMLRQGLEVDDEGLSGSTGLQAASYNGDYALARFLLSHGAWVDADMDTGSGHNETSLHAAVERGDRKLVELLLAHGADPTIKNWRGDTALDVAEDEIRALLEKKSG